MSGSTSSLDDPLLAAVMEQLRLALRQSWYQRTRGVKTRKSRSRRNILKRRRNWERGETYDIDRGSTIRDRVRIAMAQGTPARVAEAQVREDARRRETAVLELLRHLVGRARELLGDTEPGEAYGELIRRAEHRLTHPAPCLRGLSEERKRKISESLRKRSGNLIDNDPREGE